VLAPHLGAFVLPSLDRAVASERTGPDAPEGHRFAGREVLVVESGPVARETLLRTWAQAHLAGQSCLVVASDDCVVRSLRDSVRLAGGSADEVIESRRLAGIESQLHEGPFVVLGALPTGVREAQASRCVQVVITAPHRTAEERLGVAAEVARPRYLVSELGW